MRRKVIWLLLLVICILAGLFALKIIRVNGLLVGRDAVRGVDVSQYQGEIDWDALAAQDVRFAYIKATEGSSYVDPRLAGNWAGAALAGIPAGAYHFFSFDSSGGTGLGSSACSKVGSSRWGASILMIARRPSAVARISG